jgi:hypothetical protein
MACIGQCMRTAKNELAEAYKSKLNELKTHVLSKYSEMEHDDDADLLQMIADFIDELEKNTNLRQLKKLVEIKKNENENNVLRRGVIEITLTTIEFAQTARGCCVRSEMLVKNSKSIKENIKTFYAKNRPALKTKNGQREFIKLFYKIIPLILLKYGILSENHN